MKCLTTSPHCDAPAAEFSWPGPRDHHRRVPRTSIERDHSETTARRTPETIDSGTKQAGPRGSVRHRGPYQDRVMSARLVCAILTQPVAIKATRET